MLHQRMGRHVTGDRQQRGLLVWVTLSMGLTFRDLWLAAHGGGTTPSWLLSTETAAWGVSAISGLAALDSQDRATNPARSRAPRTLIAAAGAAAVATHGVRLVIYSRARVTKQG
jgi:hypothetical protein